MAASARNETAILAAAVGVGALVSYVASLPVDTSWAGLAPMLFAIPLAVALLWLGHLRWVGAACLVVIVAASFYAAIYASMFTHAKLGVSICIVGCSDSEMVANRRMAQVVGAVGGLVGALMPFAVLTLLGKTLRDRTALTVMALSLPVLALMGSIGFSQSLPGSDERIFDLPQPNGRLVQMMLFIVPWQLVFGAALAFLLRRHTPTLKARSRSPQPEA